MQALARENFLPPDKLENGFTQTLLNSGSKLVLFDTGDGAGRGPDGFVEATHGGFRFVSATYQFRV